MQEMPQDAGPSAEAVLALADLPAAVGMLFILSRSVDNGLLGRPLYEGTVPKAVIAKRRAKNRQARLSRRANRP
jgi:hypothetical protein